MENIFLRFLNISITAGWIVLAVVVLRLLLKKAPKWISCFLWGIVGLRLMLPFSIESVFSLIPSANTVDPDIVYQSAPVINSGIGVFDSAVNPVLSSAFAPESTSSVNPLQLITLICSWIWVIGIALMLLYTLITYIRLRMKVATAVRLEGNVYQSERVSSPFILGVIRPKIYMPFGDIPEHIISHERAHLKRGDHFIKPIAFILLALYWFNPLMWIAYILLCRDIELACDEKVIRSMQSHEKQQYSSTLLEYSIKHRSIAACPLAFGEVGVKARIKSVMNYKKPAFWIIIAALILCIVVSVCFLTDPVKSKNDQTHEIKLYELEEGRVFGTLFDNIEYVEVIDDALIYMSQNDTQLKAVTDKLFEIKISDIAISQNRSEDRDKTRRIYLHYEGSAITDLNFNADCTEVWIDDGVKPSYTYKVTNPETVSDIFDSDYLPRVTKAEGPVQYEDIEKVILEHNENAYLKGEVGVCTYRELLTEGRDGKMFIYLQTLYGEYIQNADTGEVESISGGVAPARLTFELQNGEYVCTEYYSKEKGFEKDFPEAALKALDSVDMDEMYEELYNKAEKKLTSVNYIFRDEKPSLKAAALTLWGKDNFQFTYSMLSSNLCIGKYTKENGKLILREDGTDNIYTFIINDKDTDSLIFDAKNSSELPKYKYGTYAEPEVCVPDGAVFKTAFETNATTDSFLGPITVIEPETGKATLIYSNSDNINVTRNANFTYSFEIKDNKGKILFSKKDVPREPHITQVTDNIFGITVQNGTGLSTNWAVYCDIQNSKVSDTFQHVLGTHGDYVIYVEGQNRITIEELFNDSNHNSYTIDVSANKAYLTGEFAFNDVDGDNIAELLIMTEENLYIFKFSKNKVYPLTDEKVISSVNTDSIEWAILH